jgi:hypothetical protein
MVVGCAGKLIGRVWDRIFEEFNRARGKKDVPLKLYLDIIILNSFRKSHPHL